MAWVPSPWCGCCGVMDSLGDLPWDPPLLLHLQGHLHLVSPEGPGLCACVPESPLLASSPDSIIPSAPPQPVSTRDRFSP